MRRAANLFDRIYEPENLRIAFLKAARGRGQAVVQQFASGLDARVTEMSSAIRDGTVTMGRFQVYDS